MDVENNSNFPKMELNIPFYGTKVVADPRRIGTVGWSFGGYLALLGAQRNADLFRCSVDIAGVSSNSTSR
jgi:dipeptidyl aminopeptidase/acylaminoacyl peptidase